MQHIVFKENTDNKYTTALLIKTSSFNKNDLTKHYVSKFTINTESIIAMSLEYTAKGTATVGAIREYLGKLLPGLKSLGTETLFVCDSKYFKVLTNSKKVASDYGYVKECVIKGFEDMQVILCPNYQRLFYDPKVQDTIDLCVDTYNSHADGEYTELGCSVIKSEYYPKTLNDIKEALKDLHKHPVLSCDIEAFSLKFYETGIGTISFCWDKHNGIAFPVDYQEFNEPKVVDGVTIYGKNIDNKPIKDLLLHFFLNYTGKLVYHNANYDIKIIINDLFMSNLLDTRGMVHGMKVMTRNIDDTKLISYLAENSTAGNKLGLKHQAHEFAGDYAEDVEDITKVPMDKLLRYNLIDGSSTLYVYEKHYPTMVNDAQLTVYNTIMIPSIKTILQMELTGVPIDMEQVLSAKEELTIICDKATVAIQNSSHIKDYLVNAQYREFIKCNEEWKKKTEPLHYFDYVEFNPGSKKQLGVLVNDQLGLPVLSKTPTGASSLGGEVLEKLKNHTDNQDTVDLLDNLIVLATASKILSTFIEAFINNSVLKDDGVYYLHGSYNLGGTLSGRLSSSNPNLQNIPSGSTYAKLIKKCFIAPKGWILFGADFDSLEDKISALTTRDPNKLKVYEDGYCGHCLRSYYYFKDQMPDINLANKNERVFKVKINNVFHYIKCGTLVTCPKGVTSKIEDYYDKMENN